MVPAPCWRLNSLVRTEASTLHKLGECSMLEYTPSPGHEILGMTDHDRNHRTRGRQVGTKSTD